ERLHGILAVVKDDPRVGVVDTVIDVVAGLAIAHGLADYGSNTRAADRGKKAARLGENLDVLREEPLDLAVDHLGEFGEWPNTRSVGRRAAAADVEQVHLRVAAVAGLLEDVGGEVQRLNVVLEIGGLASDMEADALDGESDTIGLKNEV